MRRSAGTPALPNDVGLRHVPIRSKWKRRKSPSCSPEQHYVFGSPTRALALGVAFDRGVNLAPFASSMRIVTARAVDHKRDGPCEASCVGAPFPKDAGRRVNESDPVLHGLAA